MEDFIRFATLSPTAYSVKKGERLLGFCHERAPGLWDALFCGHRGGAEVLGTFGAEELGTALEVFKAAERDENPLADEIKALADHLKDGTPGERLMAAQLLGLAQDVRATGAKDAETFLDRSAAMACLSGD